MVTEELFLTFALSYIFDSRWAITDEGLKAIVDAASRVSDPEALERTLGKKIAGVNKATVRNGIGIIPVQGPTFKRGNFFTECCGASSYEVILRDLYTMIASDDVKAILLNIDSPGGEANGCSELSDHIYQARERKPVYAFVGGLGASAAYWIASSCTKVFAAESAFVGSIGVQSVVRSSGSLGEMTFVSSLSPNKNRDPATEQGAAEVQRTVDDLAQIFVEKVARNRGISVQNVVENFGQGSIFISKKAIEKGMIDHVETFEGTILSIETENKSEVEAALEHPKGETLAEEIARATTQRILGIQAHCKGRVSDEFAASLIEEGVSLEEAALRILQEERKQRDGKIEGFKKADDALAQLDGKPAKSQGDDQLEADLRQAASLGLVTLL